MTESRCGLLCSNCKHRGKVKCQGCISIDSPFWGKVCAVKVCCEEKKLNHCGECNDFPCGMLNQFSFDKEEGDDGERILQCRKWCAQSK